MLPADQRLRKNAEFRLIYKRGRENVHPMAVLYLMRRIGPDAANVGRRIGFVVSKKQGDAVVRNRIKRRLREAVRLRLPELKPGAYDLVFVARGRLKTATWPEVQEVVQLLLQRTRVLANTAPETREEKREETWEEGREVGERPGVVQQRPDKQQQKPPQRQPSENRSQKNATGKEPGTDGKRR